MFTFKEEGKNGLFFLIFCKKARGATCVLKREKIKPFAP
jgi:hypothetical protein